MMMIVMMRMMIMFKMTNHQAISSLKLPVTTITTTMMSCIQIQDRVDAGAINPLCV